MFRLRLMILMMPLRVLVWVLFVLGMDHDHMDGMFRSGD